MKHKSSYDSINHGFNKLTIDCKDKPFAALLNNQLTGNGIGNILWLRIEMFISYHK